MESELNFLREEGDAVVNKDYSNIEEKFREVSWKGLKPDEKIALTVKLDQKYPGMMKLEQELLYLEKYPETHYPTAVGAEVDRLALEAQNPALLNGLNKAFHQYHKTVVLPGLTEKEVLKAIEQYANDMC